jgi:putative ABC transport system permease protein
MIKFLAKGLVRDRSRSTLPLIVIAIGALLTVILYSLAKGGIGQMVDTTARLDAGHVKVTTQEYARYAGLLPNDLALGNVKDLVASLEAEHPDMIWLPRIRFGGIGDVAGEDGETAAQAAVYGYGLVLREAEPGGEPEVWRLDGILAQGGLPAGDNEALLGRPLADALGISVGDRLTLISSTLHGAMATHTFTISGLVETGIAMLDDVLVIVDLEDARFALDMEDAASEIVGFRRSMRYRHGPLDAAAERFNARHAGDDPLSPQMTTLADQGQMAATLALGNALSAVFVGLFLVAMSAVLWNAGLMNGVRRYGEVGVRMALGETKGGIYRSMLAEAAVLGVLGSVLGTAAGLGISYWLQVHGIDISDAMQDSELMLSAVVRAEVTPVSFYIGFLPGVFASVLGTACAGIGILRRNTAQLFRENEL